MANQSLHRRIAIFGSRLLTSDAKNKRYQIADRSNRIILACGHQDGILDWLEERESENAETLSKAGFPSRASATFRIWNNEQQSCDRARIEVAERRGRTSYSNSDTA